MPRSARVTRVMKSASGRGPYAALGLGFVLIGFVCSGARITAGLAAAHPHPVALSAPWRLAAADAPAVTMTLHLHQDDLIVRSHVPGVPSARLLDADGMFAAQFFLAGDEDNRWWFTLSDPDVEVDRQPAILPGQIIEVRIGSLEERLVLPALEATLDSAARIVRGRSAWPGGIDIAFDQPGLLDATFVPWSTGSATDDRGLFWIAVPDGVRVGPGTLGTVWAQDGPGNRVGVRFAVPAAFVQCERDKAPLDPSLVPRIALFSSPTTCRVGLAADAGRDAMLVAEQDGAEVWRFVPFAGSNGVTRIGITSQPEGTDILRDIDRLTLYVDGQPVGGGSVLTPWTRFDPELRALVGRGPRDRPVDIALPWHGIEPIRTRSGDDGAFAVHDLPDSEGADAYMTVPALRSWVDDNVVVQWEAAVPQEHVALYGRFVLATLAADPGPATAHLYPADGRPTATHRPNAELNGPTWFAFSGPAGEPLPIRPSDRIAITSPGGTPVELDVPELSVRRAAATGSWEIAAPSSGVVTLLQSWPEENILLSPSQSAFAIGEPRARGIDVVPETMGRWSGSCTADCQDAVVTLGYRPPWTSVRAGRPTYGVTHVPRPWVGAAASVGILRGFASSGAVVTATLLGPDGSALARRTAMSVPQGWSGMPARWELSWVDRFPDGIPGGTRFRVETEGHADELVLPQVEIRTDVLADTVQGTAPPDTRIEVWGYPNTAIDATRAITRERTSALADGTWSVRLRSDTFTLKAGDAIGVNVLPDARRHFFQYDIGFVDGPDEPKPTPAGGAGRSRCVWLPYARLER